jgi:3',5'-cyclic AMP phosphodiesterase CpdA
MKFLKIIALFAITLTFINCDNFFEYSVYQANVKTEQKNTTIKNLKLLEKIKQESQDFKFAFITDVHYFYDNLRTVVEDINKRDDILFVIFGGDIADQALLKEYEIFYDIMQNLNKPYLTVIGNHDYNSNGSIIYKEMFGDYNYSFEFNNNKFVLFDDIIWESNKDPDFDWLSSELSSNATFNQVFAFAHIPIVVSNDLSSDMKQTYRSIMTENNVSLSVHGHTHSYFYEEGEVSFLIVPALKKPTYGVINVKDDTFNIEIIEL